MKPRQPVARKENPENRGPREGIPGNLPRRKNPGNRRPRPPAARYPQQPRRPAQRTPKPPGLTRYPAGNGPPRGPYTVRSVVIFELALLIAIVVYFLLRAAGFTPADAALGALGIFGVAQVLANSLIQLGGARAAACPVRTGRGQLAHGSRGRRWLTGRPLIVAR